SPVVLAACVLLWTLLWLGAMDVAVNVMFAYPKTPDAKPSRLQQYFEYGRSTEGKIRYMVGDTNNTTASVSLAGWMDDGRVRPITAAEPKGILVAVYGQSFTQHAANAWAKQNDQLTMRMILGPGAPLNHSYASYLEDRDKHDAKVCLLGILASSLPYLDTVAGMTWSFERPYTFMFPRYTVNQGKLSVIDPTIHSMGQFREALNDPTRWSQLKTYVHKQDTFFDPLTFNANVSDHSVIARMLKRAWGQRHMQMMRAAYHTNRGYNTQSGIAQTARFLVVDWAQKVRADGRLPIVYIINDRGYWDHLYQELGSTLDQHGIAYVSTHEYAPADDLSNFQSDGHFIHAVDQITAQKFQTILDESFAPVMQ
ncbi:MAG: hypothetical protein JKX85_10580, partial [Phycisphaeraceae bacterium]|nr:hypothetical protein [Phycisphaeraceae bacterium]